MSDPADPTPRETRTREVLEESAAARRSTEDALRELEALAQAVASELQNTTVEGSQTFSIDPTPQQLKALSQQHKQTLEAEERRHQLEEATKDQDAQRIHDGKDRDSRRRREEIGYYSLLAVVLGGLASSGIVGVASKNATTRDFAQGACLLILGGLIGALAGYFTGKSGK